MRRRDAARSTAGGLFVVGLLLRVATWPLLGPSNRDFHLGVILRMVATGHIPISNETDQSYHPPLYYLITAPIFALTHRPKVVQLFSLACAGFVSALVVFRRRWYGRDACREQNRFLLVLGSLFLVSLLPAVNLRLSLYQTLGERFLYLPSVFSCLLIAYVLAILLRNRRLWLLTMICVLAFYSVRLHQTNGSWREAAELTRSIKDELAESATRDHVVILNAPDNLRGVPVFHNGLPEALEYFQDRRPIKQVEMIALQSFQLDADEVKMIRDGDLLTINSVNENDTFGRVTPSECVEVLSQSTRSLQLIRRPCSPNADLFFFDKGRMARLSDSKL